MSKKGLNPELMDSPHLVGMKMSSGLKERLKRNSRSFSSPISNSLETKSVEMPENISVNRCSRVQNIVSTPVVTSGKTLYSLEDIQSCNDKNLLILINFNLKNQISQNAEKLRKLELVERYHIKNKPDDLILLIKKWLRTSQESLQVLCEKLPDNERNVQRLLNILNINTSTVQYDCDSNSFY